VDDIGAAFEKFGKAPSWKRLGQWCWVAARYWQFEWRCQLPPRGTAPSAATEKAVDIACLQLIAKPNAKHVFEPDVSRWVLQRLVFAGAFCQAVEIDGGVPLGDPRTALQIVLVNEWRDQGVEEFLKLPPLSS
jgi:hypothetical protein